MNALPQQYSLKWNDYHSSVTAVFNALRACQELVDVSLCCEGRTVKAHKVLLSACSPYFRDLFKENPCQHPVFFLKGGSFADLCCVLEFMYRGEVHVGQRQLSSFLKTAELLQVKGLSASSSEPRAVEEDFEEAEVDEEEEEQDGDDDEDAQEDDDQHHHENDADMDDDVILTHDSLHARADAVTPQRRSVPPSTAAAVSSVSSRKRPLPRLTPRPNSPAARSARHATKATAAGRGASPPSKRARSPAPSCVKTGSSVVSASSGVGGGGTLVDSIANSLKSTATEVSACGGGGGGGVSATTARISSVAAARRRQRRHKHTPDDETKRQAGAVSDKDVSAAGSRARHSNHHHSHHHNNSTSDENPGDGEMDSVDDSLEAAAGAADESTHKIDGAVEECSVPPQTTQGTSITAATAGNGKNTASVVSAAGDDTISSLSSPISAAEAKPTGGEWDSRRGAFRCPYCNRLYTHLVSLGQHMKVHQGDTTCHVCGKVLSRTTQLRIHLRQIHGVGHDDAQQQQQQQQQQQAASASSTSS